MEWFLGLLNIELLVFAQFGIYCSAKLYQLSDQGTVLISELLNERNELNSSREDELIYQCKNLEDC